MPGIAFFWVRLPSPDSGSPILEMGPQSSVVLGLRLATTLLGGCLMVGTGWAQARPYLQDPMRLKVRSAAEAATQWLLDNQLESGGWGSHHSPRPIEVFASAPGSQDAFRVATTGLVVSALLDSPFGGEDKSLAVQRGIEHLLEHYPVRRQSGIEHYNVWAFGFTLQALGECLLEGVLPEHEDQIRRASSALVERLAGYQSVDGGWGYLSLQGYRTHPPAATSMSFTTATILVGLARVQDAGVEVPKGLIARAVDSLRRCRMPMGPYAYGELWRRSPQALINGPAGAACRTPACQLSLMLHGQSVPDSDRNRALADLLVRYSELQRAGLRRPIPHESWCQISGYFYLYGHAYASYLLELSSPDLRRRHAPALARSVLACAQPDGSLWDYPLYSYHKPYGTAFALITLTRILGSDR